MEDIKLQEILGKRKESLKKIEALLLKWAPQEFLSIDDLLAFKDELREYFMHDKDSGQHDLSEEEELLKKNIQKIAKEMAENFKSYFDGSIEGRNKLKARKHYESLQILTVVSQIVPQFDILEQNKELKKRLEILEEQDDVKLDHSNKEQQDE